MRTIKDKELHEKYCNICIDSPNSLFASLDESSKSIIRQTSICKMYRKGDLIYEEGNKPFGLICLITGKAKIAKKGIAGREQIVRMAKPVGFIGYRAFFAEEMHIGGGTRGIHCLHHENRAYFRYRAQQLGCCHERDPGVGYRPRILESPNSNTHAKTYSRTSG